MVVVDKDDKDNRNKLLIKLVVAFVALSITFYFCITAKNIGHSIMDTLVILFIFLSSFAIIKNFIFMLYGYFGERKCNLDNEGIEEINRRKISDMVERIFPQDYEWYLMSFLMSFLISIILFAKVIAPRYYGGWIYNSTSIDVYPRYVMDLVNNNLEVYLPILFTLAGILLIYFGFILNSQNTKIGESKQAIWLRVVEFFNNLIILPGVVVFLFWVIINYSKYFLEFDIKFILKLILFLVLMWGQNFIHKKTIPKEGWDTYQNLLKKISGKTNPILECAFYVLIILFSTIAILLTNIGIFLLGFVFWVDFTSYSKIAMKYAFDNITYFVTDIEMDDGSGYEKAILLRFEYGNIRIVPKKSNDYHSILINKDKIKCIKYYSVEEGKRLLAFDGYQGDK